MFYDGKLIHCHKLKPGGPHHIPPLVFHNVMGQERQQEDSPSFYNEEEIDAVIEEVGVNPFCLYIQGRNGFLQSGWYSLDAHTSTKGCICDFPQVVTQTTTLAKKIVTAEIFMSLIRSAIIWYLATSTSICIATQARDARRSCRESRRCRTEAQYRTISHDRTVDQPHEFLGCNDCFGQGSRTRDGREKQEPLVAVEPPQASYDKHRHRNCFQTRPMQAFPKK